MSNHTVTCATCHIPIEGPDDPQPDSRLSCPSCGAGDTYKNVMSEIEEQVTEQAGTSIDKMLRDTFRGNDSIKVTGHHHPSHKRYRFVIDLNL